MADVNLYVDALRVAHGFGNVVGEALGLHFVALIGFFDGLCAAILLAIDVADVVGAEACAHVVDLARYVVGQLWYAELDVVGTGPLTSVLATIDGLHAQCIACHAFVAQHLCIPTIVAVLEVVVNLPCAASQFRRVVEIDFGGHVVMVAAPLGQPIAGVGGTYLLVAHLRVGEPCPCVGLNQIGLDLGRLALVVALIDVFQIHQVDGLDAVGGIDVATLGVGVAVVEVGQKHFQIEVVARLRCSVLAFVEHPVACMYRNGAC